MNKRKRKEKKRNDSTSLVNMGNNKVNISLLNAVDYSDLKI